MCCLAAEWMNNNISLVSESFRVQRKLKFKHQEDKPVLL